MGALVSIVTEMVALIGEGVIELWIDSQQAGQADGPDADPTDPAGSGA